MTNTPDLIELLADRQRDLGLTDEAFAETLGVSRQMWGLMRSRDRMPGRKTVQKILDVYPEFQTPAALFLLGIDTNSSQTCEVSLT